MLPEPSHTREANNLPVLLRFFITSSIVVSISVPHIYLYEKSKKKRQKKENMYGTITKNTRFVLFVPVFFGMPFFLLLLRCSRIHGVSGEYLI